MATGAAERQGLIHQGLGEADGRMAAKAASGASRALRLHYVDWLRALAVLTVVGYHASLPFGNVLGPWPVQNAQMNEALGRVNAVLAFRFILHMPIVLVISSFAISWSMSLWPKAMIKVLLGLLVSFGAAWAAVRIPGVRTVLGVHRSDRRTSVNSAGAPTAGVWSRPGHA